MQAMYRPPNPIPKLLPSSQIRKFSVSGRFFLPAVLTAGRAWLVSRDRRRFGLLERGGALTGKSLTGHVGTLKILIISGLLIGPEGRLPRFTWPRRCPFASHLQEP